MKSMKWTALVLALALLLAPAAGFAASPWMEGTTYSERISGKFQFGLKNVLLGWIDLFYEPNKAVSDKTNVWAGVGKGLVDSIVNIVGGAFHLITFPIPADFPLPDDGVQLG